MSFRNDLVHFPGHILGARLYVREHLYLDGPVAEGDLDDVPFLDRLAGLGDLAIDGEGLLFWRIIT